MKETVLISLMLFFASTSQANVAVLGQNRFSTSTSQAN